MTRETPSEKPLPRTITIDGPAASGKTTVGLMLSKKLGYLCLDTGIMYRAVALDVLERGADPQREDQVTQAAEELTIDVRDSSVTDGRQFDVLINGRDRTWDIRSPEGWLVAVRGQLITDAVIQRAALADVLITTALIPGRPAPVLVTEDMVRAMKPGSVIVDLAAHQGGNCPLTEPGRTVVKHGVTLIGETNLPALVAADASALYARNVLDFLKLVLPKEGGVQIDLQDDIVAACLVAHQGAVTRK